MPTLLIVCHCPSPNVIRLVDAVEAGARSPGIDGVTVRRIAPLEAGPDDVLQCDALIVGTTENFGYMNGALKDFFERIYYPCLERTRGRPYALFVKAGQDGSGARDSVERIVNGLKWQAVQSPLLMVGKFQEQWLAEAQTLGQTLAAGLEAGIF